jgi:CubicO group peptidase (beta-lactamase class C family)
MIADDHKYRISGHASAIRRFHYDMTTRDSGSGHFDPALQQIDQWVADGIVPGVGAAVWRRGLLVGERYAGEARPGSPVTPETLFGLASVSKPLTAAAVIATIERGDLELDAPLSVYVPEFGSVGVAFEADALPQLEVHRERVTIRHLLCHVSGLPENIGARRLRMSDKPDLDHILDVMTSLPLLSVPGEQLRYSNAGYGLLALAVERVSEGSFFDVLKQDVIEAFRLDDVVFKPSADERARIAHTADAAGKDTDSESYNSQYWQQLAIPWGGYFGSAVAMVTFASTFLPGHERGLRLESMRRMRKDQTGRVPGGVETAGVRWNRGAWGFGWEVKADKSRHWTGTRTSEETFCHWGQSGTLVWADPQRELAFAVFANRTVHKPWPLNPPRWSNLSDSIVEIADSLR